MVQTQSHSFNFMALSSEITAEAHRDQCSAKFITMFVPREKSFRNNPNVNSLISKL